MPDFFNFGVQNLLVGSTAPYSGPFESGNISPINGVQSADFSLNWPRQDIGIWDGNGSAEIITRPTAQLDFGFIYSPLIDLTKFGLSYNYTGKTNPALSNLNYEKNYYLVANIEGRDMIGHDNNANSRVLGLGNAVLNRLTFNSSIGQASSMSMSVDGLNLLVQTGDFNQPLPSISKQNGNPSTGLYSIPVTSQTVTNYFASAPSSIVLSFESGMGLGLNTSGQNQIPLDSFSFTVDIPRVFVKDLGWAYPENRPVQWPVTVTVSANGTLNRFQSDYINRYLCNTGMSFSVDFKTGCNLLSPVSFRFDGAKLDSEAISASIGSLDTANLNWSLKIFDINRKYPNFYINSVGNYPYSLFQYSKPDQNLNWTSSTPASSADWSAIAFGNNLFVAGANSATTSSIMTSVDGINWTLRTTPSTSLIYDIAYGNGIFVVIINPSSGTNKVMTSTDGITWTIQTTPNRAFRGVTYGNGLFVAVGLSGAVMTSTDGINWIDRTTGGFTIPLGKVAYGNGLYVAVQTLGGGYGYSSDGINWTSVAISSPITADIAYGNGTFVTVGVGGEISRSTNGSSWTLFTGPNTNSYSSITFGFGRFIAVANNGTTGQVITSTNGTTWTAENSSTNTNWQAVTYGNGNFIAVTTNAVMKKQYYTIYPLSKNCYLEISTGPATISNGNEITIQDYSSPTIIKAIPEDGSNIETINLT
jgi:hypothetical protein